MTETNGAEAAAATEIKVATFATAVGVIEPPPDIKGKQ
jgi:hypothetical protein